MVNGTYSADIMKFMMMIKFVVLFLVIVFSIAIAQDSTYYLKICQQALEESLIPVRPGIDKVRPFWNKHATMFIYAPAFENSNSSWIIPNPKYFRYTAFSFTDKQEYIFTSNSPYKALSPIWKQIPAGKVYLKVEAISDNEKVFNLAGSRFFVKSSPFNPPYPPAKYSYKEALIRGLKFQFNQAHIQNWLNV
jgi:hypothetical protein